MNTSSKDKDITSSLDGLVLSAPTVTLPYSEKLVKVLTVTLRSLPVVSEAISLIFSDVIAKVPAGMFSSSMIDKEEFYKAVVSIIPGIVPHMQKVYEALALLTSLTTDEFVDLPLDEAVLVIVKVVEVNRDFFTGRVLKAMESVLPAAQG